MLNDAIIDLNDFFLLTDEDLDILNSEGPSEDDETETDNE